MIYVGLYCDSFRGACRLADANDSYSDVCFSSNV